MMLRPVYAVENARSLARRNYRKDPPDSLRALVGELRKAYRDEVPGAIHKHDVDGGGTPAYSGEFAAWLYGSPWATDKDDDAYRTPFRACLTGMHRSSETATRQMAAVVGHITIGGEDPVAAVRREAGEIERWIAHAGACRALGVFWSRLSDVRRDLRVA